MLVLLSACATRPAEPVAPPPPPPSHPTTSTVGPVAAGGDTYVVTRETTALPPHMSQLTADVTEEAKARCAGLKRTFHLISTTESPRPYSEQNHAKVTLIFSCD
ncbi:MAG: hypothetical protein HXX19_15495 [Rhodoferax sp.]|nr:hypothetical protein [Rhodoferax sp.]